MLICTMRKRNTLECQSCWNPHAQAAACLCCALTVHLRAWSLPWKRGNKYQCLWSQQCQTAYIISIEYKPLTMICTNSKVITALTKVLSKFFLLHFFVYAHLMYVILFHACIHITDTGPHTLHTLLPIIKGALKGFFCFFSLRTLFFSDFQNCTAP